MRDGYNPSGLLGTLSDYRMWNRVPAHHELDYVDPKMFIYHRAKSDTGFR